MYVCMVCVHPAVTLCMARLVLFRGSIPVLCVLHACNIAWLVYLLHVLFSFQCTK
jgi:hypothetical protein